MNSATGTAAGLALGLLSIGLTVGWVASLVRSRSLGPNGIVGLKTRATKSSPEAWYAGHDAAVPALWSAAIAATTLAFVNIGLAVVLSESKRADSTVTVVGISSFAGVVALLAFATMRADRVARRVRRAIETRRPTDPPRRLGDPGTHDTPAT
ncbi:SdpI family protein [Aeromicrobium alkaliterrae]|uniref:SdpI family protein n=1 Tax=Aeromicrobium alkaliterrae TaxID=302168 RepID=A0ABN2JG81_9ACTN